jgi:hypothetical protein
MFQMHYLLKLNFLNPTPLSLPESLQCRVPVTHGKHPKAHGETFAYCARQAMCNDEDAQRRFCYVP